MWSLDNLHVLQIQPYDQKILGQFKCKAESNMGKSEGSILIQKQLLEKKMIEHMLKEKSTNNVLRNVQNQEALPLVSSSVCHIN